MPKSRSACEEGRKWYARHVGRACIVRSVIVLVFLIAAVLCGIFSESEVRGMQQRVQDDRYNISSDRGLANLADSLRIRMQGMATLSKVAGYCRGNESVWPNSFIPGFYDTVEELIHMINLENICFMPMVQPVELPAFEGFMFTYFDSEPEIPPDSGEHSFGNGVYGLNPSNLSEGYHDTTGVTVRYKSPNTFLTPILQMVSNNYTVRVMLSFNSHSSPYAGPHMDSILSTCFLMLSMPNETRQCGIISDATLYFSPFAVNDYHSLILQPVHFGHNLTSVIGFVGGEICWQKILAESFYAYVGLDVVIVNSANIYTYSVNSIELSADFVGLGDLHDPKYSHYRAELIVSAELLNLVFEPPYKVYVYPNEVFFENSLSNTPVIIGSAVGVAVGLTTIIIAMYDVFMRRETRRKAHMLTTKRKFVRFISHEIRTPLNSVHLGLEMLVEELKQIANQLNATPGISASLLARVREALTEWLELSADLIGNSETAVDVLNDLLNYDKIEMGTLRLEFGVVPIWPLVEKVLNTFKMQAKQKDITLNSNNGLLVKYNAEEVPALVVIGDCGRIAQVLRNLLSNALKFTPAGGAITVTAEWRADGLPDARSLDVPEELKKLPRVGSVCIYVQDTGVGLTPEQLAHIGAEGVQFDANKLQSGQGSGLGLYISKGLMEQHGGKLHVASEGPGHGSTFSIELPLYRQIATQALITSAKTSDRMEMKEEISNAEAVSTRHAVPVSVPRVLVVDDAVSNRKMLIRLLKARGYECEQAEDGQQAIDVYRALQDKQKAVDTIVMDYEMPVMNGPTATKKLRELGCTCLIVGVTGNLLPEDVDYFKAQGADEVLGKPINIKRFEEILQGKQGMELRRAQVQQQGKGSNGAQGNGELEAGIEMA